MQIIKQDPRTGKLTISFASYSRTDNWLDIDIKDVPKRLMVINHSNGVALLYVKPPYRSAEVSEYRISESEHMELKIFIADPYDFVHKYPGATVCPPPPVITPRQITNAIMELECTQES